MLNKDIPKEQLDKLKLLVLDSDGVTVPRGTEIKEKATDDFLTLDVRAHLMTRELADLIIRLRKRLTIMISSGRSLVHLQTMYGKILGEGTILQAENGNLSLVGGAIVQHVEYGESYFTKIASIRDAVRGLPIKGVEPKQFILSVHADHEIVEVYDIVKEYDPEGELRVMWNGEAFDIQKKEVSKAFGLERIMGRLSLERENVIAIGDRVNDTEMVALAGVGVSADQEVLTAEYWTEGNETLPGRQLVEYLLSAFGL